jgi:lipopolysaccharide export system protein LptA
MNAKIYYIILIIASLSVPSLTVAQSLNFATGNNDQPIEITADNGIEWQRDNQIMVATGNAKAVRGKGNIQADVLQAYYKKNKNGGSGLVRLDAIGKLKISSPTQSITGDTGVYDLEKAILVVTGKKVTLLSGKNKITSNKQMEYYEKKEMAVARGNAVANHDGKILRANTLVALFFKDKNGKSQISRVQAFENVNIVTKTETIWANKGIYDVVSGIITLNSNVRIKRDGNELNGENAIINLNTGISKLLTSSGANSNSKIKNKQRRSKKRVRGLLLPKRK